MGKYIYFIEGIVEYIGVEGVSCPANGEINTLL